MNRKKRLLVNFSVTYVLVSALLFGIFVVTYRTYFYRLQEQMVLTRARQNEEIFLNKMAESFRSAQKIDQVRQDTYQDTIRSMAKLRLKDLTRGLKALSEERDLAALEAPDEPSPFIEGGNQAKERLKNLLKPVVSQKEAEQPFVEFFDRFNDTSDGLIEFKRFSNGLEQMVNMSYIFVDSVDITLKAADSVIQWEIRCYIVPKAQEVTSMDEMVARLKRESVLFVPRLGVYPYGGEDPIYVGEAHQLDSGKLKFFEAQGLEKGEAFFSSPDTFVVKGIHQGKEVTQHLLNSFYTDPSLGMTFVLHRVINEPEWTQFSFYERNKLPIFLYIILAWVVCPLLFWWGIRVSTKFQFNFTVDLEGLEEDPLESISRRREERMAEDALMSSQRSSFLASQNPQGASKLSGVDASEDGVGLVAAALPNATSSRDITSGSEGDSGEFASGLEKKNKPQETAVESEASGEKQKEREVQAHRSEDWKQVDDDKVGPLTRRLMEERGADPVQDHVVTQGTGVSDIESIRQNNIRKSSGSYNRHEGSEEDVDYLAGVQSDVLKSLIKKLRED